MSYILIVWQREDIVLNEDQVRSLNEVFGLPESQIESILVNSLKPGWQKCPLCHDHLDESDGFRWDHLLNDNVCQGCSYELYYALVGEDERPLVSEGYNYSDTQIGKLEQLTGQTFHQLRFRQLTEEIKAYLGAAPEYLNGINFLTLPESELRLLNKRLDDELLDIIETKENTSPDTNSKFDKGG
jgi:hypothetical protein